MSYLVMESRVIIGDVTFENTNSFTVEQSVNDTSDTAQAIFPRSGFFGTLRNPATKNVSLALILSYIRPGMPVTMQCGYNGLLVTEFTGFVKPGISSEFPVVVDCDEMFLLRQNNYTLSFLSMALKTFLRKILPANYTTIECPDMQLGKTVLNKASTVQILKWLKETYGLQSRVQNNVFSVGWVYDFAPSFKKTHTYTIGENVRNAKNLKFKTDIDFDVQINVTILNTSGTKKVVKHGSSNEDGNIKNVGTYKVTEDVAQNIAKAMYNKTVYNGYVGTVEGFHEPVVNAGDSLIIIDDKYPEREGTYLVDKVTLSYGENGIIRSCTLGAKVSV